MKKLPKEIIDQIIKDKKVRIKITRESHPLFFGIYLPHYITHPSATFHDEIFAITENTGIRNTVVVAFRGSGKSTIMTLSYPLWSILGKQQKKFILILGHTMNQARMYMKNIKEELETNELLRSDLGPFREDNEWQVSSIIIPNHNARITCASYEQGIRGIRHRQYRPDLIICDDVENLESVKTMEGRNKVYQWLTGEVIPAGDQNTKLIIVGNLLHEDSLIMRLKKNIEEDNFDGIFRAFPLIDNDGQIAWPGKYPTPEDIEIEKRKVGSDPAWQREYMLKIVPETDTVVPSNWIQYRNGFPKENPDDPYYIAAGIDLAISEKETADYTAIVLAKIYGHGNDLRIYIERIINKRINFPDTKKTIKELFNLYNEIGLYVKMFIEDVGYQRALIETLRQECYSVEGVSTMGQDKRSRLAMITPAIKDGVVLFPKKDADPLINQLTGFGVEKHDDLVDAFVILVTKILEENRARSGSFDGLDNNRSRETIVGNLFNKDF